MRRIALAAVALVFVSSQALAQGKVSYAKVYLSDDRVIEGEVTAEDDNTITIKGDRTEGAIPKSAVIYTVKSDVTPDELKAKRRAKNVYTSLLLGYKLVKPDDWSFKLDPPSPLSDVVIRSSERATIELWGQPSDGDAFDDSALKGWTRGTEAKLKEKFRDVKNTRSEKSTFKELPSLVLEFTLKHKDSGDDFKTGTTIFRKKGKDYFAQIWAPSAKYDKSKAVYDQILSTFEFTDPNPQDGDRLFNQDALFAVEKPSDWTFAKTPDKTTTKIEVLMAATGKEAWVKVEGRKSDANASIDAFAKDVEGEVTTDLKEPTKVMASTANVCGRVAKQFACDHSSGSRRHFVYCLKEQERGYVITVDYPTAKEKAYYSALTGECLNHFRILNSLLAADALERGINALELFDKADIAANGNQFKDAIGLYEQALASFPRFSSCWNNLGVARSHSKDDDGARKAFQHAFELYGEDPIVRGNLASSTVNAAVELLNEKKVDEAARLVEQARSLLPPDAKDELKAVIANGCLYVGFGYEQKDKFETAVTWMEKALKIKPKDPEIMKHASNACLNAAITAYNNKSTGTAKTWAKKALDYDATNAKAKQILDELSKKK